MGVSNLDQLIEMLNFNYAIALLLEYAAFFKLRISRPNIERPYRIPLNTLGCTIFFFPTIVTTLLVMSLANFNTYYFALGSWITGLLVYATKQQSDRRALVTATEEGSDNRSDGYAHVARESFEDDDNIDTVAEIETFSDEYS